MSHGYYSCVMGCMLGGAIGDALGKPIEFMSLEQIRTTYGPDGLRYMVSTEVTDDTQMTLFTAEGPIRARLHRTDPVAARNAYLRWLDTQQFPDPPAPDDSLRNGWLRQENWLYARRAPGTACLSGLYASRRHRDVSAPGSIGEINPLSKSCGSVMRSAPFRLAVFDPFETAARCSYLTQGHPTASLSAGAFASIIHDLVHGDSLEHAVQQALTVSPATPRTRRPLAYCAPPSNWPPGPGQPPKRSNHSPDGSRTRHSRSPSTARSPNPTPPSKALLLAVNQSGDSDSARAICGNNLSAQHGFRLLPADWVDAVEGRQTIVKITYDLLAEPTSHSYRTDHYPLLRRTLLFRPARRTGPDRRRAWTRHSAARATTSCACTPPGDQVLKLFPTRGLRTMRAAHKDESNFIVPTYSRVGSP